jgi:hypothetical protein
MTTITRTLKLFRLPTDPVTWALSWALLCVGYLAYHAIPMAWAAAVCGVAVCAAP